MPRSPIDALIWVIVLVILLVVLFKVLALL